MSSKSYYDILGVASTATAEDIRKAYLVRSKMFHPDRFDHNTESKQWHLANEMLKELNQAYYVLRDARARAEYDSTLRSSAPRSPSSTTQPSTTSSSSPSPQRQGASSVSFIKPRIIFISIGTILVVSALLVATWVLHSAAGTTFLIDEGFEGTGWSSGWWTGSTTDPDSIASPLAGSQSLRVDAAEPASYTLSASQADIYGKFLFRASALPASFATIFTAMDASFNTLFSIKLNSDGTLTVGGGGIFETTVATMSANTLTYIWWRYTKGTGANAVLRIWFNTTDSKPADGSNNSAGASNGTQTADLDIIGPHSSIGSVTYDFDNVQAAATSF
jgi:curved DNA-binding protein CbpA